MVRYLLAWALGTWLLSLLFKGIDRATRAEGLYRVAPWYKRLAVFMVILLVAVVAARGTLRPAAASVLTRVMSWPPGARTISTLTKGKRLLKALMTSCSTSVKFAV